MPSDLDLLIDHYERQIVRLKNSIKENLELHFYREVEFDESALGVAQRELDMLLELKNPNYPKIKRLEDEIYMFERLQEKIPGGEAYYQAQIDEFRFKLKAVEQQTIKPNIFETQILDDAIFQLIQREYSSFKLHLDIENTQYLELSLKAKNKIQILFYTTEDDWSWFLEHSVFKDLDFIFDSEGEKLKHNFILKNQKNILPVKELLSRIVIGLRSHFRYKNTVHLELIKG